MFASTSSVMCLAGMEVILDLFSCYPLSVSLLFCCYYGVPKRLYIFVIVVIHTNQDVKVRKADIFEVCSVKLCNFSLSTGSIACLYN